MQKTLRGYLGHFSNSKFRLSAIFKFGQSYPLGLFLFMKNCFLKNSFPSLASLTASDFLLRLLFDVVARAAWAASIASWTFSSVSLLKWQWFFHQSNLDINPPNSFFNVNVSLTTWLYRRKGQKSPFCPDCPHQQVSSTFPAFPPSFLLLLSPFLLLLMSDGNQMSHIET